MGGIERALAQNGHVDQEFLSTLRACFQVWQ